MKKTISLLCLILSLSCNNDDGGVQRTTMEYSISANNELIIDLGNQPVEGGYEITKQASNFSLSEIRSVATGVEYAYLPEQDFIGKERVEITLRESIGNDQFNSIITELIITIE